MRYVWITTIFLSISLYAVSQEDGPKPRLSDESLTTEQIAVYRAVLSDYLKGSNGSLNLANMTEPLFRYRPCFKGMELGNTSVPAPVIHRLDASLVVNTKIALVDPERQQSAIKGNDPAKPRQEGH